MRKHIPRNGAVWITQAKEGENLLMTSARALIPKGVNLAGLVTQILVANLPDVVKPASQGKKRTKALWGLVGVKRRGACRKNCRQRGETLPSGRPVRQVPMGINNHAECLDGSRMGP